MSFKEPLFDFFVILAKVWMVKEQTISKMLHWEDIRGMFLNMSNKEF